MQRNRNVITEDIYSKIEGKVFVDTLSSYSHSAIQVVGRTECYVRTRDVKMKSQHDVLGNGTYAVDYEWIGKNPYTKGELTMLYSVMADEGRDTFLSRSKDPLPMGTFFEDTPGKTYSAVTY